MAIKNNSLEILGVMRYSNPSSVFYSDNTDSGVRVDSKGQLVPHNYPTITNFNKTKQKRMAVFSAIQKATEKGIPVRSTIDGALYEPDPSNALYKSNGYDREDVLDYMKKMNSILEGDGAIYSFDIEVTGSHPLLREGKDYNPLNEKHYSITEVAIWKTYKSDGEWIDEKVSTFASSPEFIDVNALYDDTSADKMTMITLQRLAGYENENSIDKDGNVTYWDPKADMTDRELVNRGSKNVIERTPYTRAVDVDSDSYKAYRQGFEDNVLKPLLEISEKDNSLLFTMNGIMFDVRHILAETEYLGLNEDGKYDGLFRNHVDNQVIQSKFIADEKYAEARKYGYSENLKLENQGQILRDKDPKVREAIVKHFGDGEVPHMASYDAMVTNREVINTFLQAKEKLEAYKDVATTKIDTVDSSRFVANKAFKADSASLHYSVRNGEINAINSYLIKRDVPYKMSISSLNHVEGLEDLENSLMVELTDEFEPDNKVVMFYNDMESIQRDLIDNEVLQHEILDGQKRRVLKKSLEENKIDNIRKRIEGFGSTTSWKKVDSLENLVDQYLGLQSYTIEGTKRGFTNDEIKKLLDGTTLNIEAGDKTIKITPESVLTNLVVTYDEGGSKVTKVQPDRLELFKGVYGDLEANAKMYKDLIMESKRQIGSSGVEYVKTHSNNEAYVEIDKGRKLDDLTATFGHSIDGVEKMALDNMSEYEKIKFVIDGDKRSRKMYDKLKKREKFKTFFKDNKSLNSKTMETFNNLKLSQEEELKIMKKVFSKRYRQKYDLESQVALDLLRGKKEVTGRNIATSISVLNGDGEYSMIPFKSKKAFHQSLSKSTYRIDRANDNLGLKKSRQLEYLDEVARDLEYRGLLSYESARKIESSGEVRAKLGLISSEVFEAKNKAYGIIEKAVTNPNSKKTNKVDDAIASGYAGLKNLYKTDVITDEEFNVVSPFIENRVMNGAYTGDVRTIAGIPLSKHMEKLKINNLATAESIVSNSVKVNVPNFTISGHVGSLEEDYIDSMLGGIYDKLNWSPSNRKTFTNILKSKEFNTKINKYGKDVNVDNMFISDGDDIYLAMTTNLNLLQSQVSNGASLEDIQGNSALFKLPKVEVADGTSLRYVSQSKTQKKALSKDIVPNAVIENGEATINYTTKDTVDQVLESFGKDVKWVYKNIESGKIDSANSAAKRSWKKINESKTLTGVSDNFSIDSNGKLIIDSVFSPNRSDYAKEFLINRTPLIYEMGDLLKDEEFYGMLVDFVQEDGASEIKKNLLPRLHSDITSKKKKAISYMSELPSYSYEMNVFMGDNIEYIANTLLKSKDFLQRADQGTVDALNEILSVGHASIRAKENDFYKGVASSKGIHNLVPFSDISNPLRNVQEQSLNSYSVFEDSIKTAAKHSYVGEFETVDELYEKLGIRLGMGVTTEESNRLEKIKYANEKSAFGFTVEQKYMSPIEFNNKLKTIHDTDSLHDIIRKEILERYGIKDISTDEIKKAAMLISQSSNPFEDGGMINIMLADNMVPNAFGREKVAKVKSGLKVGDKIRPGDVIGFNKKNRPVIHNGVESVIRNIDGGEVLYQVNEHYNSIKLNNAGSEKGVYSAPNFVRGTEEYNERMTKIISGVQYHLSEGASIVSNPDIIKHGSSNTAIVPYMNAVTMSIDSEADLKLANEIFSSVGGGDYIRFEYSDIKNGYVTVNKPKTTSYGSNLVDEIDNALSVIREKSTGGFKDKLTENIGRAERGIGYTDVFLSSNNTKESSMDAEGYGKGVSASVRSTQTYGTYMELDEDIIVDYKDGTNFYNIIKANNEAILKDNAENNLQVRNIMSALLLQGGEEVSDNVRVKDISLSDIVIPNGLIDGEDVHEIFKGVSDNGSYNVFAIDVGELGISIDNLFYKSQHPNMSNEEIAKFKKVSERTGKVFIPALSESYVDGVPIISETQKEIARFLESVNNVTNKTDNGFSMESAFNNVSSKFKRMYNTMVKDITAKDGLRIKSQSTRNTPGTLRLEVQSVINPEFNEDGTISHLAYGDKITKVQDGKVKYVRSAIVNRKDLEKIGVNFETLGKDLLNVQATDSRVQFDFLKEFASNKGLDVNNAKDLATIQKILKESELGVNDYDKLANLFMESIGVEAGLSRDPQIRPESYWGVQATIAEGVQSGGVITDAVNAQGSKADVDGDKNNFKLESFYVDKETGELRVMDYNSEIRKELRKGSIGTSANSMDRAKGISDGVIKKAKTKQYSLKALSEGFVESGMGQSGNYNVYTEDIYKQLYSRVTGSKAIVGKTSNPGLYLKRASSVMVGELSKDNVREAMSVAKSINVGSFIAEQKSIDYKLFEHSPAAVDDLDARIRNASNMESVWNNMFIDTRKYKAAVNKSSNMKTVTENLQNSIVRVLETLHPYVDDDVTSYMLHFGEEGVNTSERFNEIAVNIIKGKSTGRNTTSGTVDLEEFVRDVFNMFNHDKSAKMYTSILNRQSLGSASNVSGINKNNVNDVLELIKESSDVENNSVFGEVIMSQVKDKSSSLIPRVGDTELSGGTVFYIGESDKVKSGVYQSSGMTYDGTTHTLNMIDVKSGETHSVSSKSVDELSKILNDSSSKVIGIDEEDNYFEKAVKNHMKSIENNFMEDYKSFGMISANTEEYIDRTTNGLGVSAFVEANAMVFTSYDPSNTVDMINTIEGLKASNYNINPKEILRQMNESLKSTGSKDYQKNKKKILMGQSDLVARGITSDASYNALMNNIKPVKPNFDNITVSRKNINRKAEHDLVGSIFNDVVKESNTIGNIGDISTSVKSVGIDLANQLIDIEDNGVFESLNSLFISNQHNQEFRQKVLNWDMASAKKLMEDGNVVEAINLLNDSILIYSKDHAGKKLGQLSLDQLKDVLASGTSTGISSEVVEMNNDIIKELILQRGNHDIMLEEVAEPIITNYKDDVAKVMREQMQEEIRKKGAKIKSNEHSSGLVRNALDKFKGKVSSMSKTQKAMAGVAAVAGLGATAMVGANSQRSKTELQNENEQLIKSRSSVAKAPPSDSRIYTSDNDAINVNVRARSNRNTPADMAERAISSLFGNNVAVNSNIQDDRREISDREVDSAMERVIR